MIQASIIFTLFIVITNGTSLLQLDNDSNPNSDMQESSDENSGGGLSLQLVSSELTDKFKASNEENPGTSSPLSASKEARTLETTTNIYYSTLKGNHKKHTKYLQKQKIHQIGEKQHSYPQEPEDKDLSSRHPDVTYDCYVKSYYGQMTLASCRKVTDSPNFRARFSCYDALHRNTLSKYHCIRHNGLNHSAANFCYKVGIQGSTDTYHCFRTLNYAHCKSFDQRGFGIKFYCKKHRKSLHSECICHGNDNSAVKASCLSTISGECYIYD